MMMPPDFEPDEAPRHNLLKSDRPSIVVASVATLGALSTLFEPQMSLFSLIISNHISFLINTTLRFKISKFYYLFQSYFSLTLWQSP